jgi:hypothetical protein
VRVVVNGNGEFTPAHVLGSTSVFISQAFNVTFEFTPTGGPTETETDTSSKPNVHGDLVTCSFDVTQAFPGGQLPPLRDGDRIRHAGVLASVPLA